VIAHLLPGLHLLHLIVFVVHIELVEWSWCCSSDTFVT